jgi:glycine cleavage system H protein
MAHEENLNFKDYVIIVVLTLGALALIPLFAVFGFALQFAFVVVMPVLLVGSAIYALTTTAEIIVSQVQGVDVPSDVRLHPGHGWARRAPGCVVAGVDDFAQRLIGPVDAIETVSLGMQVKAGDVMAILRHGGREIPIRAPISGKVTGINPLLRSNPSLVNQSPYGRGWLVEIAPEASNLKLGLKQLLGRGRATRWMRREIDRLVALTAPDTETPTLADGGELSVDACAHLDDAAWKRVVDELFP